MKIKPMPSIRLLEQIGKQDAQIGRNPRLGVPAYLRGYSRQYALEQMQSGRMNERPF